MQTKPAEALVGLFYEDIVVGAELTTESHAIPMDDVLTFARITLDTHPLHTEPDYCRNTSFGRPIVHGLHGLSLIEGLKTGLRLYEDTSIASLGWDKVMFRAPIFPDDRLHVRMVFDSKRESRNGHGIVIEKIWLINQDGAVVIEGEHAAMVKRRDGKPASAMA
jgi:acyl dehydratase